MEPELRKTNFADLRVPVVTNVDAEATSSGTEARDALIRQITSPVRWEDSIRELIEQGVTAFVEVGPGRVLSGLLRQIDRSVHSFNVEDLASLQSAQMKFAQLRAEVGEA
jgi:[acyl-carrier-protein] S-malonyltransferase